MLSDEQAQVLRTEALKKAVSRARADADTISAAMGTNITGVQRAETSSGYTPVYFQNYALDSAAAKVCCCNTHPVRGYHGLRNR